MGSGIAGIRDELIQGAVLDGKVQPREIAVRAHPLRASLDCGLGRLFGGHLTAIAGRKSLRCAALPAGAGGNTPPTNFAVLHVKGPTPVRSRGVTLFRPPTRVWSSSVQGRRAASFISHPALFVYKRTLRRTTLDYAQCRFICGARACCCSSCLNCFVLWAVVLGPHRCGPGSPGSTDPAGPDLVGAPALPPGDRP